MSNSLSAIRIIIADDHPIFRRGLRAIVEADPQLKVVGEADDGEAALQLIRELQPDIAILDVDMPGKDGFEVTRDVQDAQLPCEIVFLTMHKEEEMFNAALDCGAKAYVLKDSALPEIVDCIKAVSAQRNYISPQLSTFLFNRSRRAAALAQQKPTLKGLTPSEQRILKLIAEEKTSRQIAEQLHISVRTVEHHRASICLKLNLRGSNALLKFAVAHRSEL
jgi:DNA-binding NarL/FixJ family response regulator